MIYIGSARDQAHGVQSQLLYNHRLGWRVFRANDAEAAERIASLMSDACANPNLKYSQSKRCEVLQHGITKRFTVFCDCSSLLTYIVRESTRCDIQLMTTATMPTILLRSGLFSEVPYKKEVLMNGDILCTKTKGHCAVIVGGAGINTGYDIPLPTLRKGSRGTEVYKLQKCLNRNGAALELDGIFGKLTFKALQDWQYRKGLKPDGIYGIKSFNKMREG